MSYPVDINDLAERAHETALAKGFWQASDNVPTKLMLIVTEVAEAMEVYRSAHPVTDRWMENDNDKPCGFVIELADIIIRVLDLSEHYGLNIQQAMFDKMSYNKTRPQLHGKIV